MKVFIIIVLRFIITSIKTCSCPSNIPESHLKLPTITQGFNADNEIINGIDYGQPFLLSDFIFLKRNFTVRPSIVSLEIDCPPGYRVPTAQEYESIIDNLGNDVYESLLDPFKFNAKPNTYYISSTKSYLNSTSGRENDSWKFKAIYLDESKKLAELRNINTFWNLRQIEGRCIQDTANYKLQIDYPEYDLIVNTNAKARISSSNIFFSVWKYNNQLSLTKTFEFTSTETGCHLLEVWGKALGNIAYYSCIPIWTKPPYGSDLPTSLFIPSSIKSIPLDVQAVTNFNIFFKQAICPVAPKQDGGFYLMYSEKQTNKTKIIEYNNDLQLIQSVDIGIKAFPHDIIATDWGFVIFVTDHLKKTYSYINGYSKNYILRFHRVIMNNDLEVTKANPDQIIFYDDKSKPVFGMNAMVYTNNGKLAYGKGKIALIFAHYNFFRYYPNGSRSQHTGDTFITFDEYGKNEKYGWSWKVSHSCIQHHLYDGRYFITSSLGDGYPENIVICFIDTMSVTNNFDAVKKEFNQHPTVCKSISPDIIPGDGIGGSCGRLGGLIKKESTYYLVSSITPCKLPKFGEEGFTSSTMDLVGLLSFNFINEEITNVKKISILPSSFKIKNIRAAKYGSNILITYAMQKQNPPPTGLPERIYYASDTEYVMLVDFSGKILTHPTLFLPFSIPTSEDFREMSNGAVTWAASNRSGKLTLYSTVAPSQSLEDAIQFMERSTRPRRKLLRRTS